MDAHLAVLRKKKWVRWVLTINQLIIILKKLHDIFTERRDKFLLKVKMKVGAMRIKRLMTKMRLRLGPTQEVRMKQFVKQVLSTGNQCIMPSLSKQAAL
jgi:hypothetical protein